MKGAKGVIISITGGEDMRLMEVDEAASHIKELVDPDANIIWGSAFNNDLGGKIRVSVVATGIEAEVGAQPLPAKVFSFPARQGGAAPAAAPAEAEEMLEPEIEAETASDDEVAARRAVVGPEACDLRRPFVELGPQRRPEDRADALPAEPRINGQPYEIPARVETARLVVDLAVAEGCVLLVDGDDADAFVARVVPPPIFFACHCDGDIALLSESLDADEGRIVAVGEKPDASHTRRPGRTPASRR